MYPSYNGDRVIQSRCSCASATPRLPRSPELYRFSLVATDAVMISLPWCPFLDLPTTARHVSAPGWLEKLTLKTAPRSEGVYAGGGRGAVGRDFGFRRGFWIPVIYLLRTSLSMCLGGGFRNSFVSILLAKDIDPSLSKDNLPL